MDDENDLKAAINNFVWMNAPESMPLREAEQMAINIFNLFRNARDKHAPAQTASRVPDYPVHT